jgi:carbon storage regulator
MDTGLARDRRAADGLALAGRRRGIAAGRIYMEVSVLVLSRREGEAVVIPDCRVEIVVKEISAGFVRLGFKAPDNVDIYRDEIWKDMCFQDWNQRSNHDGAKD